MIYSITTEKFVRKIYVSFNYYDYLYKMDFTWVFSVKDYVVCTESHNFNTIKPHLFHNWI